jgi:hypothetical protein
MKIIQILISLLFLQQVANAQLPVSIQRIKLPGTNDYRDLYVARSGNDYLMNGDIIVDQHNKNITHQGNTDKHYTWPKGYIPIEIEDSAFMFSNMGATIYWAIENLQRNTRVRFIPRTNEKDYIFINYATKQELGFDGGSSWVGRHGGRQVLNLTTTSSMVILHELVHALGFWHEQSRPDRDNYVQIQWDNIEKEEYKHNFQLEAGTPNGPYDYLSLMHYFPTAFAKKDTKTIKCKSGTTISDCNLGNSSLSPGDIKGINDAYWYNNGLAVIDFQKAYEEKRNPPVIKSQVPTKAEKVYINAKTPISDGMYKIKVNHTGKYLAIEGVSKDNGARLVQWDYVDQPNHKFYVRSIGDGFYEISAVHSNRYLNASGQSKADGTAIIQWDYANQDNVKWRIYYSQQSSYPGWVIENKNASPIQLQAGILNNQNGISFILWMPKRHDAHDYDPFQTFSFERIGDLKPGDIKSHKSQYPGGVILKKGGQ